MHRTNLVAARTKQSLKGLSPVLKNWANATLDFCKRNDYEDTSWWYNERASLSVLAGAAWRTRGWSALEEFSTTKRGVIPEGEIDPGRIVRGRCDLYVAHGSSDYAIEAKQAWQSIGSRARVDRISQSMTKAWSDVGNLNRTEASHRLAVSFAAVFIPVSEVVVKKSRGKSYIDESAVRDRVIVWLKNFDFAALDAYAYVFPKRCKRLVNLAGTLVFPGTMLCVRERRKANRHRR